MARDCIRSSAARRCSKSALSIVLLATLLPSFQITYAPGAYATVSPTAPVRSLDTLPPSVVAVVQAYGGAQKIIEHHNQPMRSQGSISSNSGISSAANTYQCEVIEHGDRVRVEMTMLGVPMIMGYNGKDSWTQYGDWVAPATATTTEMIADELKHGLPALADALNPSSKVESLGKKQLRGKACDVFRVTASDGRSTTFYADPQTHLITRADYTGIDHELGVKALQSVEYSEYKPVAGSLEPLHVVQYSGEKKKSETLLTSVEADSSIKDDVFEMPPETEISRLQSGAVTIPFEYTSNEIIIKARINNGEEQRFVVDTGASQSVVDKATALSLGPHPVSTFSITAGSKAVPLSYAKLSSLDIGDLVLNDVPVLITDLSNVADHPAGLIGANILKRFLVTIDFENKEITFADPRHVTLPEGAATVPTYPVFGGTALIVKGMLNDKTDFNFLVDTGASFNNLPQSFAKQLYNAPVLPVGTIYGLDGQKISIGAIKLKDLKLGTAIAANPVFTLAPDNGTPVGGLFNAQAMGILGNPIWSQFKTTIDYRNERLILEAQPGHDKVAALLAELNAVDQSYLRNKNIEEAQQSYQNVITKARQNEQTKSIEALAIARIAGCYADKYSTTKEGRWLDAANREYEHANTLANESLDRAVEGQVLAAWSLMFLNAPRTQDDFNAALAMVAKALKKAPMEPSIFAAFGATSMRAGKYSQAEKLLDRALVLDPSNWQALWSKYNLLGQQGKTKDQALVAAQLQHYYPGYPDVVALPSTKAQPLASAATAPKSKNEVSTAPVAATAPQAAARSTHKHK